MNARRWTLLAALPLAGCAVDLSLPRATPLAPLSGSVLSSRTVTVQWRREDVGGAPLCLDVFDARTAARPWRSFATAPEAQRFTFGAGALPPVTTVYWSLRDCAVAASAEAPRWQFAAPLAERARGATVLGTSSDLDGDGRPDLFFEGLDEVGPRVRPMAPVAGWRGSAFEVRPRESSTKHPLRFRSGGDLDGDGYVDLLLLGRNVELLFGGASPELVAPVDAAWRGAWVDAAGGHDLDADGRADVVVLDAAAMTVCHVEARALACEAREALPFRGATALSMPGDVDGDRRPEVAVVAGSELWVRWGRGGRDAWQRVGDDVAGGLVRVASDLDGDGRNELAWATRTGFALRAGADLSRLVQVPVDDGDVRALASGDFDGDGARELAVLVERSASERVLRVYARAARCEGDTACAHRETVHTASGEVSSAQLLSGDDDGDGTTDLFVRTSALRFDRVRATDLGAPPPQGVTGVATRAPVERPARPSLELPTRSSTHFELRDGEVFTKSTLLVTTHE